MRQKGLEKQLQRVVADIAKVEKEAGCSDQRELEIRLADANKKVGGVRQCPCLHGHPT